MKNLSVYNPIYDEVVSEVNTGLIVPGINRDYDNYNFRIKNIMNGSFTKDDFIALFILSFYGNDEGRIFIENLISKIKIKVENDEELEEWEKKLVFEIKDSISAADVLKSKIFCFNDTPESLINNDIILNSYRYSDTYKYMKEHIEKFDRQFFKDLIATRFILANDEDENIFSIMPVEYIDEEMCLLAVLEDHCNGGNWFREVYKRKPEVLTERLWKLAARLYVFTSQDAIDLMRVVPKEYKDYEFYQELCSRGSTLFGAKENVTDVIPSEILTPQFLLELVLKQSDNVASFSESALNTELTYKKYLIDSMSGVKKEVTITQKAWQIALLDNAENIWFVQPDEEKLRFFLHYYPKGSEEYDAYIVGEENIDTPEKDSDERPKEINSSTDALANAIGEIVRESKREIGRVPRKYGGELLEFNVTPEEDMLKIYEKMGIIFGDNYDTVGPNNYLAVLPEGWKIVELQKQKLKIEQFIKGRKKKRFTLNNQNGEVVLEFSRITDGDYSNSFVDKIYYEKVDEASKNNQRGI